MDRGDNKNAAHINYVVAARDDADGARKVSFQLILIRIVEFFSQLVITSAPSVYWFSHCMYVVYSRHIQWEILNSPMSCTVGLQR
jgi:hypothetical protein